MKVSLCSRARTPLGTFLSSENQTVHLSITTSFNGFILFSKEPLGLMWNNFPVSLSLPADMANALIAS